MAILINKHLSIINQEFSNKIMLVGVIITKE